MERFRRLIRLGDDSSGFGDAPDMDSAHFVYYDWALDAIKADSEAWLRFQKFPNAYKCVKIWNVQHYEDAKRHSEAVRTLQKFTQDAHCRLGV